MTNLMPRKIDHEEPNAGYVQLKAELDAIWKRDQAAYDAREFRKPAPKRFQRSVASSTEGENETQIEPPESLEFLLWVFLPRKERDDILGDLLLDYAKAYQRFGHPRSNLLYGFWSIRTLVERIPPWILKVAWKTVETYFGLGSTQ